MVGHPEIVMENICSFFVGAELFQEDKISIFIYHYTFETLSNGNTMSSKPLLMFSQYAYTMAHTAESKSQDSLPITNVTFLFPRSFNVLWSDFRYSSIIERFYHVYSRDSSIAIY